eukprot:78922-Hanusia_phi.AAC.1
MKAPAPGPAQSATLWLHFCKPRRCGRVRLDNYIGKKRFVDNLNFSTVYGNKENRTNLSSPRYGGATFAATGRGEKAVP